MVFAFLTFLFSLYFHSPILVIISMYLFGFGKLVRRSKQKYGEYTAVSSSGRLSLSHSPISRNRHLIAIEYGTSASTSADFDLSLRSFPNFTAF